VILCLTAHIHYSLSRCIHKIAKIHYQLRHVCLSVRPSAWNNSLPPVGFSWSTIFVLFRNTAEKIQDLLTSEKITGTLPGNPCTFMIISRLILLRIRNASENFAVDIEAYILCSMIFLEKSCCLWDTTEISGRAGRATYDNIIRRMRFAWWINKATDTHWECIMFIVFPRKMVTGTATIRCYMHIACLCWCCLRRSSFLFIV